MTDPSFLLDSNICIYILEGATERATLRMRIERLHPGAAVTSAITYAEVLRGRHRLIDEADTTAQFFRIFPVVPFDVAAAARFADIPLQRGKFDHLIAAQALALNITLVTANTRDFADIPGLRVENWTQ